jgi:hypothetical protein
MKNLDHEVFGNMLRALDDRIRDSTEDEAMQMTLFEHLYDFQDDEIVNFYNDKKSFNEFIQAILKGE